MGLQDPREGVRERNHRSYIHPQALNSQLLCSLFLSYLLNCLLLSSENSHIPNQKPSFLLLFPFSPAPCPPSTPPSPPPHHTRIHALMLQAPASTITPYILALGWGRVRKGACFCYLFFFSLVTAICPSENLLPLPPLAPVWISVLLTKHCPIPPAFSASP